MRVEPLLNLPFRRPVTAGRSRAGTGPEDRVELGPPSSVVPGPVAAEGALGGLAGAVASLEGLKQRGAEFQRKRLVGELGWRSATPRQAAQALLDQEPDTLQVRLPEESWQPLRGADDLSVLTAFQGGDLSRLPDAQLAMQLQRMGHEFTCEEQPVGAWGAYARLTAGVPVQAGTVRLETAQDVAMLAYLRNLSGPETLAHPVLGEALRTFQEQGYVQDAVAVYRARPEEVALEWHGTPLGSWRQGSAEELCRQLKERRMEHARQQVGELPGELLEPAAEALDALPAQFHADYLSWLQELQHPGAASRLSQMPADQQQSVRSWLASAVPGPVGQHTWAERDGVWSDSPDGKYQNNQTSCLSLPAVDLRHVSDASFHYRCAYELENNSDWVILEASGDGANWDSLKAMTGKADWSEQTVSLAAYRGKQVQLRFRLKSDSSNVYDGISVSDMRVEGRPAFEPASRSLWPCDGQALRQAACEALARGESLAPLQALVASAGPQEGLALWQALPQQAERLPALQAELGTRAALALAESGGEVATFQAARRLCATPDDLPAVLEIHRRLHALAPEKQQQVARLVERTCPVWKPEGGWHSTADGAWSDSPGPYKHNQNACLTTPSLDLRHFHQPVVTFRQRHELENNSDWVLLEASRDGKQWDILKSFTGKSDWEGCEVSLEPYSGGPLQLRFRLKTDSSNAFEGLDFSDFRLEARPALVPEAAPQLVFSDQASAWRGTLDRILEESGGDRLERLDKLSEQLPPDQALLLLDLPNPPQELAAAALQVGAPAARAMADRLGDLGAFQVCREVARQLQQPERLDELVERSRQATAQEVPNLLGWTTDAWVRSGPGVWSDNRSGRYRPNSNNSLTTPVIALAGQLGAKLRFDGWWELENNSDFVRLEGRREGGEWRSLRNFTGASKDWSAQEVDLFDFGEGRVELRWRLTSDSSSEHQGFRLRNMRIEDDQQTFFSDRPEDLAPLHEELLGRLKQPLADLPLERGLCAALAVESPEAMKLVAVQGLKAGLEVWDEIKNLSGPALEAEIALRNQSAGFRRYGAEPSRVTRALRQSGLDAKGREALSRLASGLALAGWTPAGDWGRTARGWSDSPGTVYKPNQNAVLESPRLRVPAGGQLEFEARWQFENGPDFVSLQVDGQQLARFTGSGSGPQKVDLSKLAGKEVSLSFQMRSDTSSQYDGMDFWNLRVTGADGEVAFRDDLGQRAADGLLELATNLELDPAARSRALQILDKTPPVVFSRVLSYLSQRGDELPPERALTLIERLPQLAVGASLEELLQDGVGVREQDEAVLVGGVRVRKR